MLLTVSTCCSCLSWMQVLPFCAAGCCPLSFRWLWLCLIFSALAHAGPALVALRPLLPPATQGLAAEEEAEAEKQLLEEELALTLQQQTDDARRAMQSKLAAAGNDEARIARIHAE